MQSKRTRKHCSSLLLRLAQYLVKLECHFSWQAHHFGKFWGRAAARNAVFFHTKCFAKMGGVSSPKMTDHARIFGVYATKSYMPTSLQLQHMLPLPQKTHTTTSPKAATATEETTLYSSLLFSKSLLYSTILYSTLLSSTLLSSTLLYIYVYIYIYSP